jgi:hypothetical protein
MANPLELARLNTQFFKGSAVGNIELLQDSFALAEAEPKLVASVFYSYYKAVRDLFTLTPDEVTTIREVNNKLGSKRGANNFLAVLGDQKETILRQIRQIGNLENLNNQTGIKELSIMMNYAWTIKRAEPEWTPKDGDPRADAVIWGFVKGATDIHPPQRLAALCLK